MTTQNPGAGGRNPQAQGLREIEEDADDLRALLQGLIDHAANENEQLGAALVEYHRRALQLEDEIDRQGADNQHLVDEFNALRAQLLERLRLIPELQRKVRQESWAGQRLAQDKVLLNDEVQRLAAFVRLLQAELPTQKGGGNLRNGERSMQSREWLFLLLMVVATALGIVLGTFADQYNWNIGVIGTLGVVLAITAVVTSRSDAPVHVRLPLASTFWPAVSLDTQQWFIELLAKPGVIKTRPVNGLDAREAELATARADLVVERAELATLITEMRDTEVGELLSARDDLRSKWQAYDALTQVAPPDQPAIDAAWNEYNQAIDDLCNVSEALEAPSQELVTTRDNINVLTNAIESSPGGLAAAVARLKEEHVAAEAAIVEAREKANSYYTHPRWYWVAFFSLALIVTTAWHYANVNKIIGQSRIAEGKSPGVWVSGGETMADPNKRDQYVRGIDELPLGKEGQVTAIKLPNGRIVVFLGAGEITPEARRNIELSEYSAPR